VSPFDHGHTLARYHLATPELSARAISESIAAAREWENIDIAYRIKTLLKAADLVSGKYRQDMNATTMLGQGKHIPPSLSTVLTYWSLTFRFTC